MPRTNKQILNAGDMNKVGAVSRLVNIGDGLSLAARTFEGVPVGAFLILPEAAKAMALLEVYVLTGTVVGRMDIVTKESGTVLTGDCKIDPKGDVEFLLADAPTLAQVVYIPVEGTVFEEQVSVPASGLAPLRAGRSAIQLIEASLDVGGGITLAGAKTIVTRADGAPSSTEARLEVDGEVVAFNATDAGTGGTATVKYVASPGSVGVDDAFGDLLEDDYPGES